MKSIFTISLFLSTILLAFSGAPADDKKPAPQIAWGYALRGVDVEAARLHRHFLCLISQAGKFSPEIVSYRSFVARDRLDIDQLARERDCIHGGEDSRG